MATRKKVVPFDWEALAKNLQEALEKQIDETENMAKTVDLLQTKAYKLKGIIEYLEHQQGK